MPIDLEAPSLIEIAGVSEERFVTKIGMGRAGDEFVTIEIVVGYCEGCGSTWLCGDQFTNPTESR